MNFSNDSDDQPFSMSKKVMVLMAKPEQVIHVPLSEWDKIKDMLKKMSGEPWLNLFFGSLAGGAALSTVGALLTGAVPVDTPLHAWTTNAWYFTLGTIVLAAIFLGRYHGDRRAHREKAENVLTLVDVIDCRFERQQPK